MKKLNLLMTFAVVLSGCVSAEEKKPHIVDGKKTYTLTAVVMRGTFPPTEEDRQKALVEAREGEGWTDLPAKGNTVCKNGYDILRAEEIRVDSYFIAAVPEFAARWFQTFTIACK